MTVLLALGVGFSVAASTAAFIFGLLSYKEHKYTPWQAQTMINEGYQAGHNAAFDRQPAVPPTVPHSDFDDAPPPTAYDPEIDDDDENQVVDAADFVADTYRAISDDPRIANQIPTIQDST